MRTTCTRTLEFDAAHRVLGHGGKCQHLHGHRYKAEITVRAANLNDLGMVIDFSAVKTEVGGWIDAHLDHNLILSSQDPVLSLLRGVYGGTGEWGYPYLERLLRESFTREPYVMPGTDNPTAENLAALILNAADELLKGKGIEVVSVKLWETPNCWAEAKSDPPGFGIV